MQRQKKKVILVPILFSAIFSLNTFASSEANKNPFGDYENNSIYKTNYRLLRDGNFNSRDAESHRGSWMNWGSLQHIGSTLLKFPLISFVTSEIGATFAPIGLNNPSVDLSRLISELGQDKKYDAFRSLKKTAFDDNIEISPGLYVSRDSEGFSNQDSSSFSRESYLDLISRSQSNNIITVGMVKTDISNIDSDEPQAHPEDQEKQPNRNEQEKQEVKEQYEQEDKKEVDKKLIKVIEEHWYNDDEINFFLQRRIGKLLLGGLEDEIRRQLTNQGTLEALKVIGGGLMDSVSLHQNEGATLKQNLQERIRQLREVAQNISDSSILPSTLILPVSLGYFDLGGAESTGNHWAALYIRNPLSTSDDNLRITYIDPFGNQIPARLQEILQTQYSIQAEDIVNLGIPFQSDSYNCGPWIIEILKELVRTDGLFVPQEGFDMNVVRAEYWNILEQYRPDIIQRVIEDWNREHPFSKVSTKDKKSPQVSPKDSLARRKNGKSQVPKNEDYPTSAESGERWKLQKQSDLRSLLEIYKISEDFISDPKDVIGAIKKIGSCAKKINYNEKDKNCIRNKYSTVNPFKQQRTRREEGVNLVELKHLSDLIERDHFPELESDEKKEKIKIELIEIKKKLLFVFSQEKGGIDECDDLKEIDDICNNSEFKPTGLGVPIEFISELSHLYYDQLVLKSILKEMDSFEKVVDFSKREDRYYWGRIFVKVGELLHPDELSDSYELLDVFRIITNLRAKLVHNHRLLIDADIKKQKELFKSANDLFGSLRPIAQQLLRIIEQKQNKIEGSEYNDLDILKDSEDAKRLTDAAKELEAVFKDGSNSNKNKVEPGQKNDKAKEGSIEGDIMRAAYILSKNEAVYEKLESLDKEYQGKLLKEGVITSAYPIALNKDNQKNIFKSADDIKKSRNVEKKKNASERKKKKGELRKEVILRIIDKITKELDYVRETESNTSIPEEKKQYVTQHAIMVIGQYERDLIEQGFSEEEVFNKVQTVGIGEAYKTGVHLRSKGLGHEPLSLDHSILLQGLHNDLLPSYQDYRSIYIVAENSIYLVPQTAIVCERVGDALLRLCYYEEALEYFDRAIKDLQNVSNLSGAINSNIDQYKLDSLGITQPETIVIDMSKVFFGVDDYELVLMYKLLESLFFTGKLNELCEKAEDFITKNNLGNQIKYTEEKVSAQVNSMIEKIKDVRAPFFINCPEDDVMYDIISAIFGMVGYVNERVYKHQEAVELYKQALNISRSEDAKKSILYNLIRCYVALGDYSQIRQDDIEFISRNNNLLDNFLMRVYMCGMQLNDDYSDIAKIDQEIESLEEMFRNNRNFFKDRSGDMFLLYPLKLLQFKLTLCCKKESDYDEVNAQIKRGLDIIGRLTKNGRHFNEVSEFYYLASNTLSGLVSSKPELTEEFKEIILTEANKYFLEAEKKRKGELFSLVTRKKTAENLATAYSNYVLHTSGLTFDKRIKNLERAKKIQDDHKIETFTTIANLGSEYANYASEYYEKKKYNIAILYYKKAIETLESIRYIDNPEALYSLIISYEGLGDSQCNVYYLDKAQIACTMFTIKYPVHSNIRGIPETKQQLSNKINKLKILM